MIDLCGSDEEMEVDEEDSIPTPPSTGFAEEPEESAAGKIFKWLPLEVRSRHLGFCLHHLVMFCAPLCVDANVLLDPCTCRPIFATRH